MALSFVERAILPELDDVFLGQFDYSVDASDGTYEFAFMESDGNTDVFLLDTIEQTQDSGGGYLLQNSPTTTDVGAILFNESSGNAGRVLLTYGDPSVPVFPYGISAELVI